MGAAGSRASGAACAGDRGCGERPHPTAAARTVDRARSAVET